MAPRRRDGCPMPIVKAPGSNGEVSFCVRRIEWGRSGQWLCRSASGQTGVVMMGLRAPHVPRHLLREEEGMRDGPELDLVASDMIRRGTLRGAVRRDDVLVHPLASYDVGPFPISRARPTSGDGRPSSMR